MLQKKLQEKLGNHEQSLLFLNRRGAASAVLCRACGSTVRCQNCDLSLTYHKKIWVEGSIFETERLICHQCGKIEKHIHFSSPPGTNGEKDFYNVMVKMLPSATGTSLPSSFQVGDYFVLEFAWKLANVYNINVQNRNENHISK